MINVVIVVQNSGIFFSEYFQFTDKIFPDHNDNGCTELRIHKQIHDDIV